MSRIGKLPITLPKGVTVTVDSDNVVRVKGPKGELSEKINSDITVTQDESVITVTRPSDEKIYRSLHGLSRSLIANMVEGVTNGFTRNLEIVGVGYRAQKQDKKLVLSVGYSHPVEFMEFEGVEIEVPSPNKIVVKGINKQVVGELAAKIRETRKPEPYKGKGIRYEGEFVKRKEGKSGK